MAELSNALASGRTTSRELVEACLEKISDPSGEGARTFIKVNAKQARETANRLDARRRQGIRLGRLAGIPVSVKDLFDMDGHVTLAGSRALVGAPPATSDALAVRRMTECGFILVGRTNMTEFAYSGLGINPHYGTPLSPWRRDVGHIPGGSSSGAAVSVADGMAYGALGSDTGGSCRIPAAFCGLVGYKASRNKWLMQGAVPLAPSCDSAGVLAKSVDCCAVLGAAMGMISTRPAAGDGRTLGVVRTLAFEQMDTVVAQALERALSLLSAHGFVVKDIEIPAFSGVPQMNAKGGFPAAESFHWHRSLLEAKQHLYDPRVRRRIERGKTQSASDYIDLGVRRAELIRETNKAFKACDALIMPTVAIAPPSLDAMDDDEAHQAANALCLRNTGLVNLFDGCAVSLPIHRSEDAPAGLMLSCRKYADQELLSLAKRAESAIDLGRLD